MASEIKKYVSVNDSTNVVQGEMKFPDAKLKIQDGNEYKDINNVFIKGVQIQGAEGSAPIAGSVDSNGVATITIDGLDVEDLSTDTLEADDIQAEEIIAETLSSDDVVAGEIKTQDLYVDGINMNQLVSNLGDLKNLDKVEGSVTVNQLQGLYNSLIEILKTLVPAATESEG